jgi:hypothetical protein
MTDPKFIGPPQKLFKSYTMPKAKTATEIGKDIMKKTNVGAGKVLTALGSPIRTTKKILSKVKSKFTATAAKAKDATKGAVSNLRRPGKAKIFTRAGKTTTGLGKQNPFVAQFKKTPKTAKLASKALRVAKFARAATPFGLATVAVTSIKKRDPKAVKRERDFYKGKKYKDVGFESMLNYKSGGLKEATKKLKAQGYVGGKMANLKKIPEGPEGEGLRKLKSKRPDVTRKMGFAKKGKVMKAMAGKSVRGFGAARTSGMGLQDEQMVPGKSMDYYKDLM